MMSMHGPSNLSKAWTSMTDKEENRYSQDLEVNLKRMVQNNMCFTGRCASLARYMNERAQNCTKFTQAFDTPHSIGRCSSGFVCDESKLPKILAPGACSDVHLLFFLVCFCLAEKKKCVLQVSRDFFLIKGLSKGWRCKLTRLLFIVILTWPDSTM